MFIIAIIIRAKDAAKAGHSSLSANHVMQRPDSEGIIGLID
jgi:hypothetical protein